MARLNECLTTTNEIVPYKPVRHGIPHTDKDGADVFLTCFSEQLCR